MTSALKTLVRLLLPDRAYTTISAIRARRHSQALQADWGIPALNAQLTSRLGWNVRSGPFAGLRLPASAAPEHLSPYLLGTYEREIHGVWAALRPGSVPLVVNIGAKFGFYAVGLGRQIGRAHV